MTIRRSASSPVRKAHALTDSFSRAFAILALLVGLALRLYFVSTFPAQGSGDAPFYIELAWNWLKKGVYGFPIGGVLTPVDMRVPGYPAFLAAIFTFAGKSEHAVMLVQVFVDLATCVLVASIAARLAPKASRRRVALAALWLAVLCPFTANYTAVVLTETLVTFLTALALLVLLEAYRESTAQNQAEPLTSTSRFSLWFLGGIVVGFGTLVRPETPLLLIAVGLVLLARWWRRADWGKLLRAALLMGLGLFLPLLPWAARNWNTLHDVQFLAPHYSELPGEFAPLGFNAWINTWQWRFRDVYTSTWKLDVESISMSDIPASAFDTPQQRERAAGIFDSYNNSLTWERGQDAAFGEIAREIRSRHPLRTYLKIPFLRAVTIWFTPRVELLPYSGNLFPLRLEWREDRRDFRATLTLVSANLIYIGLALAGLWIARRSPGVAILVLFILVRTIFFSIFADESPEPRYVLECFPAVIALGAQVFRRAEVKTSAS
ncbi:MAG TPA: glycosyltransferase family 39 protein [Candidatus Acidoferrales bacterium]|jgi:4-amino-4-deoxy-L-arabinose transferase-like glycosyltransferase|nr:glycosyltransferase family 39 protein [Candidatus Acidoferrales bacterium]